MYNRPIHVAGPWDATTRLQTCARCGLVLKDLRLRLHGEPEPAAFCGGSPYPEGALVEVGSGVQMMSLSTTRPTCAKWSVQSGHD